MSESMLCLLMCLLNLCQAQSEDNPIVKSVHDAFMSAASKQPDRFHPDDVERVRENPWWVDRFVYAYDTEEDSLAQLIHTMEWRKSFDINAITDQTYSELNKSGVLNIYPHKDREGRTIIWGQMSKFTPSEQVVPYCVYQFEKADHNTSGEGWAIIIDFSDATRANFDLELLSKILTALQYHYPLGYKYVLGVDMPWILKTSIDLLFKGAKDTFYGRFRSITREQLTEYIDPKHIPGLTATHSLCHPTNKIITCSQVDDKSLEEAFNGLSSRAKDKHFKKLVITNTTITELKTAALKDLSFDIISLLNCSKLVNIDEEAFNSSWAVTKQLYISYNSQLSNHTAVFHLINKFTNLEQVVLSNNNIKEIPDNAFNSSKLSVIEFQGDKISKLGKNAFASMTNLKFVGFKNVAIKSYPDYAFVSETPADNVLTLRFDQKTNLDNLFSQKAMHNLTRIAVEIRMVNNPTYLDQSVYETFLDQNQNNHIYFYSATGLNGNCEDCRNHWMTKHFNWFKYPPRLIGYACSNRKKLTDATNFKKCKR